VNLEKVNMVYCLGIGGIGVSALARYFAQKSCTVAGYDKTPTLLTTSLESEGISITFTDNEELFNYFIDKGFILKKRSEVLEHITAEKYTIAVAGTHGKTTTTTILAHIFKSAGIPITAFMGGISTNYNTNFISENNSKLIVIEADEYDRSFLRLKPDIAIVTSADPDHLDIYNGENDLVNTFIQFTERVKKGGKLVIQNRAKQKLNKLGEEVLSYDASNKADFYIDQLKLENGVYHFNIMFQGKLSEGFEFHLPGKHNLENALAAAAASLLYGLSAYQIKDALKTYTGVKRRFEYQVKNENIIYIDDYAHHPDEVKACIAAVRDFYPNKKMLVVFQPHLFSRTKDFHQGFAKELSLADTLVLLPIYPARELPMQGISSKIIFDLVQNPQKLLVEKEDLIKTLEDLDFEVIVSMGAGDIDTEIVKIKNLVEKRIIAYNLN
jgi:UDP-N-acetylmuramate--alanine ligase